MKKVLFTMVALVLAIGLALPMAMPVAADSASVWTDKEDYVPEEVVEISGSGFLQEAEITVTVQRPDQTPETADLISPTFISDTAGSFTCTYQLDGITGTYLVTATDGTNTATTTFTDAINTTTTLVSILTLNGVSSLTAGQTYNFSGQVTAATGYVNDGNPVKLQYCTNSNFAPPASVHDLATVNTTTVSGVHGLFSGTFVAPTPATPPATLYFRAYFPPAPPGGPPYTWNASASDDASADPQDIIVNPADTTPPTVTSVDTAKADGYYTIGEVIDITVTYSETVYVNTAGGIPTLALNSGGSATYNSGSGTATLTFRYTVAAGQNSADLDYNATNSLALNGGTIKDLATNNANNTLPAVGTFAGAHAIVIDTTPPDTNIISCPTYSGPEVTFNWTGTDNLTAIVDLVYQYRLDGGSWSEWGSGTSHTYSGLAIGSHTFEVKSKDQAGNIDPSPATCTWTSLPLSAVTAGGCPFDKDDAEGQQFRLIFTPDLPSTSTYKLNASNPGQFFYNIFYVGTPGETVTITTEIDDPFVTQGEMPVHVYENVSIVGGCFIPADEIAHFAAQENNSPNYNDITVTIPDTGLVYVRIHLDFGLKKTTDYTLPDSYGTQRYDFTATDGDGFNTTVTIENVNVFKHDPGFAGIVTDSEDNPVSGVTVKIYDPANKLLATLTTDEDGFYFFNYKHKGKAATYTIKLPVYGLSQPVSLKANGLVAVDFQIP
jgi:hypothetical protein